MWESEVFVMNFHNSCRTKHRAVKEKQGNLGKGGWSRVEMSPQGLWALKARLVKPRDTLAHKTGWTERKTMSVIWPLHVHIHVNIPVYPTHGLGRQSWVLFKLLPVTPGIFA